MRRVVAGACAVGAFGTVVVATALAITAGPSCDGRRFDQAEWEQGPRRDFAECVVERQPFRGSSRDELVQRLGAPDERERRHLVWWMRADEPFRMHIETLEIPLDRSGRAGPARLGVR